mmetsp:Transcript_50138/g.98132  ORF Transcript_50138/g.98132 Transcript_50138/m.98132 type:complete len:244 (-) Transcript_50138:1049-1780(-)
MISTRLLPALMSTPASAYVTTSAPRILWRRMSIASMKAGPSCAWTRALRVAAVSPACTSTTFCTTMGPPSTSSVTSWMVQPLCCSRASRTAWWTFRSIPPACFGSREGCTLRHRPAQRSVKAPDRIRMYPTSSTSSTPASSRTAVHSASYCSFVRPLGERCTVTTSGPSARPLSRIGAEDTLLATATISARSAPDAIAARTGTRAVPRVDPRTPMRRGRPTAPFAMSVRKCIPPANDILRTAP